MTSTRGWGCVSSAGGGLASTPTSSRTSRCAWICSLRRSPARQWNFRSRFACRLFHSRQSHSSPGGRPGHSTSSSSNRLGVFSAKIAKKRGVRVASHQRLEEESPATERRDVKSELTTGFPYRLAHASTVACFLAQLIAPPTPKKGLITDLDDTLWRGILGELGVRGITWDLDHHSLIHGLYQQLLGSLAETGVLIAAASKNDCELVKQALRRGDLVINSRYLFPIEAHWSPKSESVGQDPPNLEHRGRQRRLRRRFAHRAGRG